MFVPQFLFFILGVFAALAAGESAPLFCKCTCFKNSTLIQLKPGASCTQCTHAFCLSQSLPICSGADPNTPSTSNPNSDPNITNPVFNEGNVLSTCIQRDSRKDQIIVWAFLLGTAGLLLWAAVKRVNEVREGRKSANRTTAAVAGVGTGASLGGRTGRGAYAPVSGTRGGG